MLSAGVGLAGTMPESIAKALAIDPALGSTYLDAEHVVILMQENRSFDHSFGTLQGVRGFNDPRAIRLPNKNPIWLQTNERGETYAPFRLNIKDTKSTWMGSLPHSWTDQVDARNHGKLDAWLTAKRSGNKQYQQMPLTLGYYTREDLPFYYSLADAFTICDQNFCSSLTGTTPNRLYLWTGTIREKPNPESYANVRNENVDYDKQVSWKTFPELLEEQNISWKIYQNELSVGVGFEGEEDAWLSNFTDNPIEWFSQYNVKFLEAYRKNLPDRINKLSQQIADAESKPSPGTSEDIRKLNEWKEDLRTSKEDLIRYTQANYDKLSAFEKNLHERAFTTNKHDPEYHQLVDLQYNDGASERQLKIPAGDVLHQFRSDVKEGKLPTVSWLVAPENFSDHPGAPWYGAWYVSEVMDILTHDPEIWKKTIFILAYDENDGYFDHVPPFTVPSPNQQHEGLTSQGINTSLDYVTLDQDKRKKSEAQCRDSSIGLGFRVPLIIASPWNRGGSVCSQVFDHTSVLQFLEKFVGHKLGKSFAEENISAWRRTICGDLTATFKPYDGEEMALPVVLKKDAFIESIHQAQFKTVPNGFRLLTDTEISEINRNPLSSSLLPRQESGSRIACPLPYELYVDGKLSTDKKTFAIVLRAAKDAFGDVAAGCPFNIYAPGKYQRPGSTVFETVKTWSYAVRAGDTLTDVWPVSAFEGGNYHLQVYGPNGFFREFGGDTRDPGLTISCSYEKATGGKSSGKLILNLTNTSDSTYTVNIADKSYGMPAVVKTIAGKKSLNVPMDLSKSYRWYDFTVLVKDHGQFFRRLSGKVETGEWGMTDPAIGREL